MGIEKPDKPDTQLPKAWMIGSAIFLVSIIVVMFFVFLNPHEEDNPEKETEEFLISQTEKDLNVKLPEIEEYDLIQYYAWSVYNNSVYPNEMYYFIFKEEIIQIDETWLEELPQEMIDIIPLGSSEYPYICDYYKLVDLTNGAVNQIELFDSKAHEYVLYCIQLEHKRLIAIRFEV